MFLGKEKPKIDDSEEKKTVKNTFFMACISAKTIFFLRGVMKARRAWMHGARRLLANQSQPPRPNQQI